MALQHLRSNTASKRPTAGAMSDGQIAVNTNATSPGLFFKDAGGAIIKVGPVHVGTTAPNSSPAGSTGNSLGEQWLDTSGGGYVLKIWDGSAWRSEVGEFVDAAGDTMTGALILPSGTAAAPALGVGSTDNGLYSPGTDQVAISTNGTGRLFVDASGNVGIGTSPGAQLDILSSGFSNLKVRSSSTNSATINLTNSARNYSFNTNSGDFYTRDESAVAERLRITSAGLVGIGTSSPSSLLHLGGSSPDLTIQDSQSYTTSDGPLVQFQGRGPNATNYNFGYIRGVSSGANNAGILQFATNSAGTQSVALTIDSSQRVGIGTTSPSFGVGDGLEVARSGVATVRVSSNTQGVELRSDGGTGTLETRGAFPLLFGIQGTERARIDSSGRLLVGTSSDNGGALLQVNGNRIRVATAKTPASASDTGTAGEICWDASYVYVCTATNTWKRAALSTW